MVKPVLKSFGLKMRFRDNRYLTRSTTILMSHFLKGWELILLIYVIDGNVLIVIGGDDSYEDSAEEKNSFLSRWARRKMSSQFSEEYLDGRKSFIFSWDEGHRPIHEEALLHYFEPHKRAKKFVLVEKEEETVSEECPKQVLCIYTQCSKQVPSDIVRDGPGKDIFLLGK